MNTSMKTLIVTAAVTGLLSGTTSRLQAQETQQPAKTTVSQNTKAGVRLVPAGQQPEPKKHSCAGKNDCKGQGGGKDAGKNDCKGKGGCATDGSKPPISDPKPQAIA